MLTGCNFRPWGNRRSAVNWPLLAHLVMVLVVLTGCSQRVSVEFGGGRETKSINKLSQLLEGVLAYRDAHDGAWPAKLSEVVDHVGGTDAFARLMRNPLTRDEPGYEYVRPAADSDPATTVILYQLRDGQRDLTLSAAFAEGTVQVVSASP